VVRGLAQIFGDGFESGTLLTSDAPAGMWDAKTGAPTVSTTQKHHGTYSVLFDSDASLSKNLSSTFADLYARLYVYVTVFPWAQYFNFRVVSLGPNDNWLYATNLQVINIDGTNCVFSIQSGANNRVNGSTTLQLNTWYCVELYRATGSNRTKMYLNGVQEAVFENADYYDSDRIDIGGSVLSSLVYVDCIEVADAYIGPESSSTLQTVTDSLFASELTLRHKASLILSDAIGASEVNRRDRVPLVVSEAILVSDAVNTSVTYAFIAVADTLSLAEAVLTPTRATQILDAVTSEAHLGVDRALQVTDSCALVEVAAVGTGKVAKTRLFLMLGDFALELSGD
jgi:hypothetical protein